MSTADMLTRVLHTCSSTDHIYSGGLTSICQFAMIGPIHIRGNASSFVVFEESFPSVFIISCGSSALPLPSYSSFPHGPPSCTLANQHMLLTGKLFLPKWAHCPLHLSSLFFFFFFFLCLLGSLSLTTGKCFPTRCYMAGIS